MFLATCLIAGCNDSDDSVDPVMPPDLALNTLDTSGLLEDPLTLAASGEVRVQVSNLGATGSLGGATVSLVAFHDQNRNGAYDAGTDSTLGTRSLDAAAALAGELAIPVSGMSLFAGAPVSVSVEALGTPPEASLGNNVLRNDLECLFVPTAEDFTAEIQWEWEPVTLPNSRSVNSTPAVADLDGDGIPEVIFPSTSQVNSFPTGVLRAIRGDDGTEVFTVENPDWTIKSHCSVAVGDLDGDGSPEIVAVGAGSGNPLYIFDSTGVRLTASEPANTSDWGAVAIADMYQDGSPEIIMGNQIFDSGGNLVADGSASSGYNGSNFGPISVVADLDLDGSLEVVAGRSVYDNLGGLETTWQATGEGYSAVANFDGDPEAEVVTVFAGQVHLLDTDGTPHPDWNGGAFAALPGGGEGGPPTIADYDNDGMPEVGVAASELYVVFDTDGSVQWTSPTVDTSSRRTGSSVFDFNGDGMAEVVYGDQVNLYVYAGAAQASGDQVLFSTPKASGTWTEYPLVVDVDGDGRAEIIDINNNNSNFPGVRAFRDPENRWVDTRDIWNQHSYHITNVLPDGSIPVVEQAHWQFPAEAPFNSFRQNALTQVDPTLAADVTASWLRSAGANAVTVRIGNGGSVTTEGPVAVAVYDVPPDGETPPLMTGSTMGLLEGGAYEDVTIDLGAAVPATVWVVADDDGLGAGFEIECSEDNNLVFGAPLQ